MATRSKPNPIAVPPTAVDPNIWTRYHVRWDFLTWLCASVPADPDLIKKWLESRTPKVKPAGALSIQEINEEVLASIERGEGEADQEYAMLVFQRHNGVLCARAGTIKAHIKDCGRQISRLYTGRIEGEQAFSTRVTNGVNTDPASGKWFPIRRADGSPVTEADGYHDKPVHFYVQGRGQVSALKRFEYIDGAVLEFDLLVLGKAVSQIDLQHLFTYGGVHGYAGERGDGEGRYTYQLTRTQELVAGAGAAVAHR